MKNHSKVFLCTIALSICMPLWGSVAYAEDLETQPPSEEIVSEEPVPAEEPAVIEQEPLPVEVSVSESEEIIPIETETSAPDPEPQYEHSEITITKSDEDTEIDPEGTVFTLYADPECTREASSYTVDLTGECTVSTSDPSLSEYLPAPEENTTLYLKETKVPKGCAITSSVYPISILASQNSDPLITSYQISFQNKQQITVPTSPLNIKLDKTDADTGKSLAGASLEVTDADTAEEILSWTTDDSGPKDLGRLLEAGHNYIMKELLAPEGYQRAEDVRFHVSEDGTITVNDLSVALVTMADMRIPVEEENPEPEEEPEEIPEPSPEPAPETPESPQTPEISETPEVPEVPETSATPTVTASITPSPSHPATTVTTATKHPVTSPKTGDSTSLHTEATLFALFSAASALAVLLGKRQNRK